MSIHLSIQLTLAHLDQYANEGLRTLVVAKASPDPPMAPTPRWPRPPDGPDLLMATN